MYRVKKILYATDFSSYSNQAYFHAVALAEQHHASLTILFVYNPGSNSMSPSERSYWRKQLESIRPSNPDIPTHHVFLEGDPSSEIVGFCHDAQIDLVVMGTHGRTGVERMLLGSVAEHVLRDAPCSVLVVKLPRGIPSLEQPHVQTVADPN